MDASGAYVLPLPEFSASFPLPFRVLFLVGFAALLWAVNLHVLSLLGLDVSWVLDIRDGDDYGPNVVDVALRDRHADEDRDGDIDLGTDLAALPPTHPHRARPPPALLYGPVYRLVLVYAGWCLGGWVLFRWATRGDTALMERYRWLVGLVALGPVVAALLPFRGIGARERRALRRALYRCIAPPPRDPIFFCDVILADILTSFAKVLGDLYVSTHQIILGGITQGRVPMRGVGKWITLGMVCLPYLIRFRQCMLEFYHSGWTSLRPFANALKYCSAFPVIFLSAAQKIVVSDVAAAKGMSVAELSASGERWFGEHRLFRLWLLAVVVNSFYSFYWDVQKDWGLSLLELDTWFPPRERDDTHALRPRRTLLSFLKSSNASQRSPLPSPAVGGSAEPTTPRPKNAFFGLRPTLLLPDPAVYYLFTAIDVVLRFTWSLELSSHLHTMNDIESGVFLMEALELVRRWMWVFVRVEWEAVRMGEMQRFRGPGHQERTAVLWDDKADE